MILTTTEGQKNLPRYFAQVFKMLNRMESGRLDIKLPDGRTFAQKAQRPDRLLRSKFTTTTSLHA